MFVHRPTDISAVATVLRNNITAVATVLWIYTVNSFLDFYVLLTAEGHLRTNHTLTVTQYQNASHQNTRKKLARSSTHNTNY